MLFLKCIALLSKANIDRYQDKIILTQKNGKLDSLINSNEAYILPLDFENTKLEYANRAAELINAYVLQRRGKDGLELVIYLKKLKGDKKFYYPKYNGHFIENSIYLFNNNKSDLIKANNLEMLRLARINYNKLGQFSASENLAYRSKSNDRDTFLKYVNLFHNFCEKDWHFKIYHSYLGDYL